MLKTLKRLLRVAILKAILILIILLLTMDQ